MRCRTVSDCDTDCVSGPRTENGERALNPEHSPSALLGFDIDAEVGRDKPESLRQDASTRALNDQHGKRDRRYDMGQGPKVELTVSKAQ